MGNSASKKAKLEEAEKNYAEATSTLAIRDQELARTQKGLEVSKAEEARLSNEAETLRKKCAELDALSTALEQERQKHITKLQAEVKTKGDEMLVQRRVIESRTQERDDARRTMEQMEEKVKFIEQQSQMSGDEFERCRRELEDSIQARNMELENSKNESASLSEKVRLLEERYAVLSEEFGTAKAVAEEKLAAAKAVAAEELSAAKAGAAEELATAKASMTESARNLNSVSSELASTKAALSATTTKHSELQREHNESVSRRAASYEAFTATKQELAEAQEKYLTLYTAHEKQGRDLEEHLSAAKKDVTEAQQRHETLQRAHDKLGLDMEAAKKELRDEREINDGLKAELAALQKKLAEPETRKPIPEIHIQEVDVGA